MDNFAYSLSDFRHAPLINTKTQTFLICVSEALGKPKLCRQATSVQTDVHDLFDT